MRAAPAAFAMLACALAAACAPKPHTHVEAPQGAWIPLFNGKDLTGWIPKIAGYDAGVNYGDTFRVQEGVLKVAYDHYGKFDNRFGSLYTDQKYSHYWLRVEYRFVGDQAPGAPSWAYKNSGLQLHGQSPESMRKEQLFPVSVEFDLVGGHGFGHHPTGDVCENGTRVTIAGKMLTDKCSTLSDITIGDDAWVTAIAEVQGSSKVRQVVNGDLVVEYTDLSLDSGDPDAEKLIATGSNKTLSAGTISLQSNSHPIEFRRIEILPIGP